ncbi:serine protease 3-like [Drosophila innubila]|uniref:serine protease 3-like n=1 Tax=Drosophila innubila TaxID=198719 RepID=UPI00148E12D4|nr:serine protease 3-like [Drosophila innubila]
MKWNVASGWGSTYTDSPTSTNLRYTYLRTIRTRFCTAFFPQLPPNAILCASTLRGSSTCHGDSGGPLVTSDGSRLIGISSFVTGNCESRFPAGFTRITHVRDWINRMTGI